MTVEEIMPHFTVLASLPCGADLARLDDHVAVRLFSFGPFAAEHHPLREGDALVTCMNECRVFDRCPLVQKALEIGGRDEARAFLLGIVGKFNPGKGDGNLPDVRDADDGVPSLEAVPHFRGFVARLDGKLHCVVPPMSPIVDDRDDRGNSGRDGGEADERI